jgi:hypothetical protein
MVTDDPDGLRATHPLINRAWMKMTGYDRTDIGKTPRILQIHRS